MKCQTTKKESQAELGRMLVRVCPAGPGECRAKQKRENKWVEKRSVMNAEMKVDNICQFHYVHVRYISDLIFEFLNF